MAIGTSTQYPRTRRIGATVMLPVASAPKPRTRLPRAAPHQIHERREEGAAFGVFAGFAMIIS
jgi:hypothetical protein